MTFTSSDESLLREYLLGRLAEPECDRVDQKLLSDEGFADLLDLVEDEVIDEYAEGSLTTLE